MPKATRSELVFLWPDTHAPYHDERACATALAAIEELRPTRVIPLGDMFDFWAVSEHPKIDRSKSHKLAEELEASRLLVRRLGAACRKVRAKVDFTTGNHEYRLDRYITGRAPELEGMVRQVRDYLPPDWTVHAYKRSVSIGKMRVSHDFGRCGINATRQAALDLGGNAAFGHTHKLGVSFVGNHVAINCGWLGDVEAIDYMHLDRARREYQHGFGVVTVDRLGNVWPTAVPIVDGTAAVFGGLVRGR